MDEGGGRPIAILGALAMNALITVTKLIDAAALAGLLIAFAGVFAHTTLRIAWADGAASIAIGALLCAVAVLLARESRSLLLGESADDDVIQGVRSIVVADPDVLSVEDPLTMHLGPHNVLLNLAVVFRKDVPAERLAEVIVRLEAAIRAAHPMVQRLFIEATCLRCP